MDTPCRTFQYAHDNVVISGGSIYVKDPANYAAITISKSISLINDASGTATIFAASGNAITITSGADLVLIRGLTLDGVGTGTHGVAVNTNGAVSVVQCIVNGFAGNGISIAPSSAGDVTVADTLLTRNAGAGIYTFGASSGTLTLSVSRSKAVSNGFGIRLTGGGAAYQFSNVESTLIAANNTGISVEASGSNVVSGALFDSRLTGNQKSINVTTGGALLRIGNSSVQAESPGSASSITNSGSIVSFGNNAIVDNLTGNAITTTPLR